MSVDIEIYDRRAADAVRPSVSIVVLAYDELNMTKACIESIFEGTRDYELVIVDNGSSDGTWDWLRSLVDERPKVVVGARLWPNAGFPGGANAGIALSKGKALAFLNNDTIVPDTWLWRLTAVLGAESRFGAIGSMLSMCGGTAQELRLPELRSPQDLVRVDRLVFARNAGRLVQVPRLVANGLVVKRELMVRLGGFDLRYGEGNFEDDDLCVRIAATGHALLMMQNVLIFHREHATFDAHKTDISKLLFRSWDIFKEKWGLPLELPYGSIPYADILREPHDKYIYFPPVWDRTTEAFKIATAKMRSQGDNERARLIEEYQRATAIRAL